MIRFLLAASLTFANATAVPGFAQSAADLNLQVHGFATQSFIYSTNNNWDTTASTSGSAAWTEAVVNLTTQPSPRLRIGIQARYFVLGNLGNAITVDWAQADFKVNERFGFRIGKVKTPSGLLNETQDIDPAQLWIVLPQSIYPLASRDSILAHYGGVVYGSVHLGESLGKLDYRGFTGDRVLAPDDGYFQQFRDVGLTLPNPLIFSVVGGKLDWHTPVPNLVVGASVSSQSLSGIIDAGGYPGTFQSPRFNEPSFFGRYDRKNFMLAGEYERVAFHSTILIPPIPATVTRIDDRNFYLMTSYRLTGKLGAGLYYSSSLNRQAAFTSARYQKDWALTARYDFNPFLYAKAEQHWIDGTAIGFDAADNPNLQPTARMTMLKLGVSF